MQILNHLDKIKQTPIYVIEEEKLIKNCELLARIKEESKSKILLALKAFSFTRALGLLSKYLDGATSSGLWESKLAKEFMGKLKSYKEKALNAKVSIGLRINPEFSSAPKDLYNPCARFSRLGVLAKDLSEEDLDGVDGLHFHALCEESAQSLELVLKELDKKFKPFLKKMKWLNFGGGHHITKQGYDTKKLIELCKSYSQKYSVQIYLEPGEAVAWQCGSLVSSVLDIIENEKKIALLDTSNEAHMPDTVIMPYTSELANARIVRDDLKEGEFSYLLGGISCLAGDIMGEYAFKKELKKGDKLVFLDQAHYSIVKNTTFNGVRLPSFGFLTKDNKLEIVKTFSYEDFKRRN